MEYELASSSRRDGNPFVQYRYAQMKNRHEPEYALFARWPEDGDAWIHPDDVDQVKRLIPSRRIFRKEAMEGRFQVFRYGAIRFRVLPALHETLRGEGLDVGDRIEVRSRMGKNRPLIGRIREMRWNPRYRRIEYFVRHVDQPIPRWYSAADLNCLDRKEADMLAPDVRRVNGDG